MRLVDESVRVLLAVCLAAGLGAGRAAAQLNSALDFDGDDDYVEMNDTLNFDGPFTVEAWVYARSGAGGGRIVSNREGGTGWELDINNDGLGISARFTLAGSVVTATSFASHMNAWTHVAVTWEGPTGIGHAGSTGAARIYIDGALANTGTRVTDLPPSTLDLALGSISGQTTGYFDGRLDEIRIWDAVLEGTTISGWMHSHVTPDHPDYGSLLASWRLDEGDGQVVESEVGGSAMTGTLGGSTGVDAEDPTWVASDVVPVEETSVGAIKARFRSAP